MNWKRGLARIYLVLWAAFGLIGLAFTWTAWNDVSSDRARVNEFLRKHPGLKLEWLQDLKTETIPTNSDTLSVEFAPGVVVDESPYELRIIARTAQSEHIKHPATSRAKAVGLWLLICGMAPATLLVIARWITEGFAKN